MQKLLLAIDKVSTFVGQTFAWFIVALTLMISWEVFSRYVLDAPHLRECEVAHAGASVDQQLVVDEHAGRAQPGADAAATAQDLDAHGGEF